MSVEEKIGEILKEYQQKNEGVRLSVVTDDQGFVIGAYPYAKEKTELLEAIGAVFSELLRQVFETISIMAPKIADKIVKISVGLKSRIVEFYPEGDINLILLKTFENEEH